MQYRLHSSPARCRNINRDVVNEQDLSRTAAKSLAGIRRRADPMPAQPSTPSPPRARYVPLCAAGRREPCRLEHGFGLYLRDCGRWTLSESGRPRAWVVLRMDTQTHADTLRATMEQLRAAYLARDVPAMLALFSGDAEVVVAPGTFRGKEQVGRFLRWDAELSPTVSIEDVGVGVCVAGPVVVWERIIHLSYEDIPYHEDAATILEFDEAGLIHRYRSYYDKLAVIAQIASGLPGTGGWVTKGVVGVLTAAGSMGLEA